jgi:type I restriction-modification system DNA methylase subunit
MPQVTKESFSRALGALVRKYEADRDTYLSSQYNEAQTRTQFISPLLEALGWDVRNEAGVPYNQCEVLEEKGETHGRPDYTLRINGQTKFFFEAKRPSALPLQRGDILQTKRYAWSGGIYFAGICDFEQFRFFDSSLRPDEKRPLDGEAFHLIYNEYTSSVDTLWELSRERVAAGSLDQFLRKDRKSLLQRVPVDKDFLEELTKWRQELASAIHAQNQQYDAHQLNDIVQRLLDRIIFIRIAEDRKVIDQRQLWDAVSIWEQSGGRRNIMDFLVELFHNFNDRFNGEIFKPHPCEEIKIESHVLAKIIGELYPPKSNYRFDVIGVELLGSIYERYLGNTLRVTAKRVFIEPKLEVRKAEGVYYTPQLIVDYIVQNTVGKLVEGKTPKEIDKLRILDPACGSGSFLIGAFQFLIDWYMNYYREHPKEAATHGLMPLTRTDEDGNLRLSFYAKSLILQHNLYGVDIDPQAVEITMMSLYLKMLEGEVGVQIPKQDKLPELKYNIRCGNSLIGPDIEKDKPLTSEERQRINPFDWHSRKDGFGDTLKSGGFDAVIGNPPYIDSENMSKTNPKLRELIQASYSMTKGNWDIYIAFFEKGFELLHKHGWLSFITPDKWISKPFGDALRRDTHDRMISLLRAGRSVFGGAKVDAIVSVLGNTPEPTLDVYDTVNGKIVLARRVQKKVLKPPYAYDWLFSRSGGLLSKIEGDTITLSQIGLCENACATSDAYKLQNLIEEGPARPKTGYMRIVNTGTIDKYLSKWGRRPMTYLGQKYSRPIVQRGRFLRVFPNSYGQKAIKPKIIIKGLNLLDGCLDQDGNTIPGKTTLIITSDSTENLKLVLAIVNSRVAFFYIREKYPSSTYNEGTTFTKKMLNDLPIPVMSKKDRMNLISMVNQILSLRAEDPEASLEALQGQIDNFVHDLYGITAEERKIIEAED